MVFYALREGVYACVANQRVALLDVKADRYFGLPKPTEDAFLEMAESAQGSERTIAALAPLIDCGLLIPSPQNPPAVLTPQPKTATRNALALLSSSPTVWQMSRAAVSQVAVSIALKHHTLDHILRSVRLRKLKGTRSREELQDHAISAFLATRCLFGTQDRCLRWSLAMIDYLATRGVFPELVLGVRMAPFAAHAWVQFGDQVLNDDVDNTRLYTPILVI